MLPIDLLFCCCCVFVCVCRLTCPCLCFFMFVFVYDQWGTSWGEEGYMYLEYGQDACAIATDATWTEVKLFINGTAVKSDEDNDDDSYGWAGSLTPKVNSAVQWAKSHKTWTAGGAVALFVCCMCCCCGLCCSRRQRQPVFSFDIPPCDRGQAPAAPVHV